MKGGHVKIPVPGWFIAAVLVTIGAGGAGEAESQSYPSRPIELIVHTGPGGGSDLFTRVVADIITREKLLAQPVVVLNRGGGGGAVAYSYVSSKRGDPYTVLAIATTVFLTVALRSGLDIGPEKFQPLGLLGFDLNCLAVREDSPYRTFRDLVEAAKASPKTINVAVGSVGATGHYLVYLIEKATGARFNVVSMKSGGEAVLAVLGGHVHATTENLSEMMQQVEAKKMRVLGVPSENRLQSAADLPTFKEQGLDVRAGVGRGFAMSAGVPGDAAAALEAAFERVYRSAAWREYATRNLFEDVYLNGTEFAHYLANRRTELQQYIQDIGLAKPR